MAVYEEFIDFLATELSPEKLANFQPTEETKQRVEDLIRQERYLNLPLRKNQS